MTLEKDRHYSEPDVINLVTLDTIIGVGKIAKELRSVKKKGEIITMTREDENLKIVADDTVLRIWKGAETGVANELLQAGLGDIIRDIVQKHKDG